MRTSSTRWPFWKIYQPVKLYWRALANTDTHKNKVTWVNCNTSLFLLYLYDLPLLSTGLPEPTENNTSLPSLPSASSLPDCYTTATVIVATSCHMIPAPHLFQLWCGVTHIFGCPWCCHDHRRWQSSVLVYDNYSAAPASRQQAIMMSKIMVTGVFFFGGRRRRRLNLAGSSQLSVVIKGAFVALAKSMSSMTMVTPEYMRRATNWWQTMNGDKHRHIGILGERYWTDGMRYIIAIFLSTPFAILIFHLFSSSRVILRWCLLERSSATDSNHRLSCQNERKKGKRPKNVKKMKRNERGSAIIGTVDVTICTATLQPTLLKDGCQLDSRTIDPSNAVLVTI